CTLSVTLSRGCPGEAVCDLPGGAGPRRTDVPAPRRTGRYASGEWALYPLADQVTADGTAPDHMRDIHAAIENARERGTFRGSEHFVTRLEGDVGEVIATAVAGWLLVGRSVQHVTSPPTLSLSSPRPHLPSPRQPPPPRPEQPLPRRARARGGPMAAVPPPAAPARARLSLREIVLIVVLAVVFGFLYWVFVQAWHGLAIAMGQAGAP